MDTEQEAAILMERLGKRKGGRYFVPDWKCPTIPGDTYIEQAAVDPVFAEQLEESSGFVSKVVERLNTEYRQVREALGKEAA